MRGSRPTRKRVGFSPQINNACIYFFVALKRKIWFLGVSETVPNPVAVRFRLENAANRLQFFMETDFQI